MATSTIRTKIMLFAFLLATVILLVILYASGVLRFGLSQQFTYILYTVAGLLAAVTCFGLLSSFGRLNGERNGINLELGGAIVAFVVVTGGGGLYEKYLHTPETITMTILFTDESGQQESFTGTATLYIGAEPKVVQLRDRNDVTFQGIPSNHLNEQMNFTLKGNLQIANPYQLPNIVDGTVKLQLKPANPYATPESSSITINIENGSMFDFAPVPTKKSVILGFRIYSQSDKIIPLSNEVLIQTISNSGAPIFSERYKLDDPVFIQPKNQEKVILDLLIPKTLLEISFDKTAIVTFYYNKSIQNSDKEFSYDFNFSRSLFNSQ